MEPKFTRFMLYGVPVLLVESRKGLPEHLRLFRYALRHGDEGNPITLEQKVLVNFYGYVFSALPLLDGGVEYRVVEKDDYWYMDDPDEFTVEEYLLDFDKKIWAAYLQYLTNWAEAKRDPAFLGCCPACFDEFSDSDVYFYDLETGKLKSDNNRSDHKH